MSSDSVKKKHEMKNDGTFLTQGATSAEPNIPQIVRFTTFSTDRIRRLSADSFTLDDKMRIGLKYKGCIIVLFHVENEESHELMKIWYIVAEQTAGPIFASCNVLLDDRVAQAFAKVKMNGSHPLNPYALHQWPVIIGYRKGFPSSVFNGEPDVQTISEWSILNACRANYFEPIQIFAGMETESRYSMPPPLPYPDKVNPEARVSGEFHSNKSKRGYSGKSYLVKTGSAEDKRETVLQRVREAKREGKTIENNQITQNIDNNSEVESDEELINDIRTQENPVVTKPKYSQSSSESETETETSNSEEEEESAQPVEPTEQE